MAYPQTPIITAFIAALSTPPLVTNSITYDAFTTVQRGQDQYVLVSQPTLTSGSGSSDCEAWDATLLLSVFTKYELNASVNFDQTLAIGTEIAERLVKQRLPLDGFDMSPIELALAETRQTSNEAVTTVQHTLRLRFEVYESTTRIFDKPLATYTPEEIQISYPRLAELVQLVCPVAPDRVVLEMSFTAASTNEGIIQVANKQAGAYSGYMVVGGSATVKVTSSGVDTALAASQPFALHAGDLVTLTRTSGEPTITLTGV